MEELEELFVIIADICDGGDYDEYREDLQNAYRAALAVEPAAAWYAKAIDLRMGMPDSSIDRDPGDV